jgi:hypothetical protein
MCSVNRMMVMSPVMTVMFDMMLLGHRKTGKT